MPSSLSADRPAAEPPGPEALEALIHQARRLRGGIDAVARAATDSGPRSRWERALCELAAGQLEDLGRQLGRLRDGPAAPEDTGPAGSAEWDLLTDEVTWSEEVYQLFGRDPADGALTLDELPSWVLEEDREQLTALVTDCLVDGRPAEGEFRLRRPDGTERTVHLRAEAVLDADGCAAAMWAVLRDVSELRRGREAVRISQDALDRQRHRLAAELREAVLPPWQEAAGDGLDIATRHLPGPSGGLPGGDWCDVLPLPDGHTLLSVGALTGQGVPTTSALAMLLGAVRGMALTGAEPGPLLGWLNQLLDASAQPALGSAVCCRYQPRTRTLCWAGAGHPAPLLFRAGTGRVLSGERGMPLGAVGGTGYPQAEERLRPGDVLLLHTEALPAERLLAPAARFATASTAQDCVRIVLEECGDLPRRDDARLLVARIG
ncbi:PP2C family protein-serine/threonine phosphatase [Streptomyces orinoci]|uniref:SpoIIE family protein phosphatase n=1 Tax=Streptomyces orinoci TaxID=67339 RepID=A0ABV3JVA6_STRON|nr:SpoIIE family protein phosphatase [Streptomyces orinoci]